MWQSFHRRLNSFASSSALAAMARSTLRNACCSPKNSSNFSNVAKSLPSVISSSISPNEYGLTDRRRESCLKLTRYLLSLLTATKSLCQDQLDSSRQSRLQTIWKSRPRSVSWFNSFERRTCRKQLLKFPLLDCTIEIWYNG